MENPSYLVNWVIYCQNVLAIDEFREARFHAHVRVKVPYLFILSKDTIQMIIFKACAFNKISEN